MVKGGDGLEVTLGRGARLIPVATYRALVKIALEVADEAHMRDLVAAVEGVRHGKHGDRPLPLVPAPTIDFAHDPAA